MIAVIKTGGKQYKVSVGNTLSIETISGAQGQEIEFEDVLLVASEDDVKIGQPRVEGALVKAEIVEQTKAPKVIIFKKNRRHGSQLKKGHRQALTKVRIKEIIN
jgi:large subunit ribosomal protein L21